MSNESTLQGTVAAGFDSVRGEFAALAAAEGGDFPANWSPTARANASWPCGARISPASC